jgi:hypothetical protein
MSPSGSSHTLRSFPPAASPSPHVVHPSSHPPSRHASVASAASPVLSLHSLHSDASLSQADPFDFEAPPTPRVSSPRVLSPFDSGFDEHESFSLSGSAVLMSPPSHATPGVPNSMAGASASMGAGAITSPIFSPLSSPRSPFSDMHSELGDLDTEWGSPFIRSPAVPHNTLFGGDHDVLFSTDQHDGATTPVIMPGAGTRRGSDGGSDGSNGSDGLDIVEAEADAEDIFSIASLSDSDSDRGSDDDMQEEFNAVLAASSLSENPWEDVSSASASQPRL